MRPSPTRFFTVSSGGLLLVTAAAKLISSSGTAEVLQLGDPLLVLPFKHVLWIVGVLELIVARACFIEKREWLQAGLIAWLATNFMLYRLGLLLIGYHKPCACLGNLIDALHVSPETADTAAKLILGYLLLGSYATLFWLWRQKRKPSP